MKFLYVCMCISIFLSCQQKEYRGTEGNIFGTYYRIIYESDKNLDEKILNELKKVNASLSLFDSTSMLFRINSGKTDKVDSLFEYMFEVATKVNKETQGAFDITVAPLVNAWGFGYRNERLPSQEKIDSLMEFVGMDKLSLQNERLIKHVEGVEIDGGAIAKGLGVDAVAIYFEKLGLQNYMVDIGGEIRVKGISQKQRTWRVGIDKPIDESSSMDRELQMVVEMGEGALATSGNYRNYYIERGKKYGHTINPITGYPIQTDILSATVYHPECTTADAYATAFMVMGFEKVKEFLKNRSDLRVCLIYLEDDTHKLWMTENFKDLVIKIN